jgi:hypothetical protein
MDEEAIRRIAEVIEKRQAAFVPAEILDSDNRRIATGEATPRSEGAHQVFHIDNPKDADTLESRAAILHRLDGTTDEILECERCPQSRYSLHFHLETRSSPSASENES